LTLLLHLKPGSPKLIGKERSLLDFRNTMHRETRSRPKQLQTSVLSETSLNLLLQLGCWIEAGGYKETESLTAGQYHT
jgi:hypothetical protein